MLWAPATGVSAGRVLRRVRGAAEGLKLKLETRPKDKDLETRPLLNHPFEPQLAPSPARAQHHVARVHALAPAPTRSMPRLACQAPARLFFAASMGNPFLVPKVRWSRKTLAPSPTHRHGLCSGGDGATISLCDTRHRPAEHRDDPWWRKIRPSIHSFFVCVPHPAPESPPPPLPPPIVPMPVTGST
jgi:hypothetical protein